MAGPCPQGSRGKALQEKGPGEPGPVFADETCREKTISSGSQGKDPSSLICSLPQVLWQVATTPPGLKCIGAGRRLRSAPLCSIPNHFLQGTIRGNLSFCERCDGLHALCAFEVASARLLYRSPARKQPTIPHRDVPALLGVLVPVLYFMRLGSPLDHLVVEIIIEERWL